MKEKRCKKCGEHVNSKDGYKYNFIRGEYFCNECIKDLVRCLYCGEVKEVNWQGFCKECLEELRKYDSEMRRRIGEEEVLCDKCRKKER